MSNSIIWLQATGSSLARGRQVISYQTRSAEAFSFFQQQEQQQQQEPGRRRVSTRKTGFIQSLSKDCIKSDDDIGRFHW